VRTSLPHFLESKPHKQGNHIARFQNGYGAHRYATITV
jgi:hypothetical protein